MQQAVVGMVGTGVTRDSLVFLLAAYALLRAALEEKPAFPLSPAHVRRAALARGRDGVPQGLRRCGRGTERRKRCARLPPRYLVCGWAPRCQLSCVFTYYAEALVIKEAWIMMPVCAL